MRAFNEIETPFTLDTSPLPREPTGEPGAVFILASIQQLGALSDAVAVCKFSKNDKNSVYMPILVL